MSPLILPGCEACGGPGRAERGGCSQPAAEPDEQQPKGGAGTGGAVHALGARCHPQAGEPQPSCWALTSVTRWEVDNHDGDQKAQCTVLSCVVCWGCSGGPCVPFLTCSGGTCLVPGLAVGSEVLPPVFSGRWRRPGTSCSSAWPRRAACEGYAPRPSLTNPRRWEGL